MITPAMGQRTVELARQLLPRPCAVCGAPLVFPRRRNEAGAGHLVCDALPTPAGTVTLEVWHVEGLRATVHHAVTPNGTPALQLHACPQRGTPAPRRRRPARTRWGVR